MPTLCAELILQIIKELVYDGDMAALMACSEVGRYWVSPCRSFIFHTVRVSTHTDLQCWKSFLKFNANLDPTFSIIPHVRRVIIWKSGQTDYGASPITTIQLLRRFPSLTLLDLREAAFLDWTELQIQPLPGIRCLTLQGYHLRPISHLIAQGLPSVSVLNVYDTMHWEVDDCEEDERLIANTPPGLRVITVESYWDDYIDDLIYVFTSDPWYWNAETAILRCRAMGIERFFESLLDMKVVLKTLYCKSHTPLLPWGYFEHIDSLTSLEVFGITLRDTDTSLILPVLCEISSPHFHSLTLSYSITGPGNFSFDVHEAWTDFRDTINDSSCFPALTSVYIDIYAVANSDDTHLRTVEDNLKLIFSYMTNPQVQMRIQVDE